jgi:uncharacterized membrane protein
MLSEKLQRTMMAFMMSLSLALFYTGSTQIASALLGFIIIMTIAWAITDFCPSIWLFSKLLKEK